VNLGNVGCADPPPTAPTGRGPPWTSRGGEKRNAFPRLAQKVVRALPHKLSQQPPQQHGIEFDFRGMVMKTNQAGLPGL